MVAACQAYYWLQPPPRLHGSGGEGGDSHDANDSGGAVRRRALLTPSQAHTSTGVREHPGCAQNRFPAAGADAAAGEPVLRVRSASAPIRVRSASSTASRSVGRSRSSSSATRHILGGTGGVLAGPLF